MAGDYTIERGDVVSVLRRSAGAGFDVILLDPPYDLANIEEALDAGARALASDGLLVLERASRREPAVPPSLARVCDVKSGDSTLTLLTLP